VYVTDVKSTNGKVEGVDFPESSKALNQYPIAVLKKRAAAGPGPPSSSRSYAGRTGSRC